MEDTQDRFGALHCAFLAFAEYQVTCAPSPCAGLSPAPWWDVTPTTTMSTPFPWRSPAVGNPAVRLCHTSEHDVGGPLISFNTLAGNRSSRGGCIVSRFMPLHEMTSASDVVPMGASLSPAGDWASSSLAFTLSCGACSPWPYTSSGLCCVTGMLLSPLSFDAR